MSLPPLTMEELNALRRVDHIKTMVEMGMEALATPGRPARIPSNVDEFYVMFRVPTPPPLADDDPRPGGLSTAQREYVRARHFAALWAEWGCNAFDLSYDLAGALLLTEPAKLDDGEEPRLPFPAFYLRVPPGIIPMFVNGEQRWAQRIQVYRFDAPYHSHDGPVLPFLRIACEGGGAFIWRDRHPCHLDAGDEDGYVLVFENDPPQVPEDDITVGHTFRLLRNFLTWLEFSGGLRAHAPRKASKKAKRRAGKGDATAGLPLIWPLLGDVRLGAPERECVRAYALGGTRAAPAGWKMTARRSVRAHWQRYSVAGQSEKRWQWKREYKRGQDGPTWGHNYKAK